MHRRSITPILVVALSSSPAFGQAFTRMINFGDSLSDVGNTNSITFGLSPGNGYYNGRYSNGPVWAEDLATSLSVPAPVRSTNSGLDYATGGSESGSCNVTVSIIKLPNALTQISSFLSNHTLGVNDLVTLWTGANDFLDGQTDPSVPAANVKQGVEQLVNAGAKNILIMNLPPLGLTPGHRTASDSATLTNDSVAFNSLITSGLDAVAAVHTDVNLFRGDVYSYFTGVLANPSAYGLTNVTDAALQSNGTTAAGVAGYLFFDSIHPTQTGHQLISSYALEQVTTRTFVGTTNTDWNTPANWQQHRTPDATSSVILGSAAVSVTTPVSVRTLTLGSNASLALTLGGSGTGSIAVSNTASPGGTLGIKFASGYIGLPGTAKSVISYVSREGAFSTISNQTAYAGLTLTPLYTSTSLSILFGATGGDANLDAHVNFDDLVILAQHYNQTTNQTWLTGDFDNTGGVNFDDLIVLAQHYNQTTPAGVFSPAFASDWAFARTLVPEPSACFALSLAAMSVVRRRRA